MTLDDAITYYDEMAETCRRNARIESNDYMDMRDSASEAEQLASWLNELKLLRERIETQPEPCEDAVSRKAVEEMLKNGFPARGMWEIEGDVEKQTVCETLADALMDLERLPSVTPKAEPKWTPCSEKVDIPDHEILACDKYGEEMFGYLVYEDDQWICVSDGCEMVDPIAWREKPEPYREEGEDK